MKTSPALCCAGDWLRAAARQLASNRPSAEAAIEAQALLGSVLGQSRAQLLAHLEQALTEEQQVFLAEQAARLLMGVPLPYLLGKQEFYGLNFAVTPAVLIPRPETELLVEAALGWLRANPARRRAADVGTGSGCIALTLAHHLPHLQVWAVDRSRAALRVAQHNTLQMALAGRVGLWQGDLLTACGPHYGMRFDLVCANLPYIPSATVDELAVTHFEPRLALDGGAAGLDLIAALLADAPRWLAPAGLLLLEIEERQGESVPALAQQYLPQAAVRLISDLAGLPRLVSIELLEER